MLPVATGVATMGGVRCYKGGGPRCCRRPPELYHGRDGRCYMELAALLPAATGVATMGDGRCYMDATSG